MLIKLIIALAAQFAAQTAPPSDLAQGAGFADRNVNLGLKVPEPMHEPDLELYSDWLNLSEAQRVYADEFFQRYREAISTALVGSVQSLWELSYAAGEAQFPNYDQAFLDAVNALDKEERRVSKRIHQLDDAFFGEFDAILADDQKPRLERARMHRQRAACKLLGVWPLLDLTQWLRLQGVDVEDGPLDAALGNYELEITPMLLTRDEKRRRSRLELVELDVRLSTAAIAGDRAAAEAAQEGRVAALTPLAKLDRRIFDTNNQWIERIADIVKPKHPDLLESYRQFAYATAFPDPLDPSQILAALAAKRGLDTGTTQAIDAMRTQLQNALAVMNQQMMRRIDDWRELLTSTLNRDGDEPFRVDMRMMRDKRWDMYLTTVKQAASIAQPEEGSDLAKALQAYLKDSEVIRQQSVSDGYPLR